MKMIELYNILDDDETGAAIVSEFDTFKGALIRSLYRKTNQHGIDYVLRNIEGDLVDKELLLNRYKSYEEKYNELIRKNISAGNSLDLKNSV